MTCDEAIERLPWRLNGTLEPEERQQVDEHLAGCPACAAALAETRVAGRVFAQHVPTEALVAYAAGGPVASADPGAIERHLEECPQCAAELELARTSRQLVEDDRVALLAPRARPAAKEKVDRGAYRAWRNSALAAGLTGLVALTGWLATVQQTGSLEEQLAAERRSGERRLAVLRTEKEQLERTAAELSRRPAARPPAAAPSTPVPAAPAGGVPALPLARANTLVADLEPVGSTTVRGEEHAERAIPRGSGTVTFLLAADPAEVAAAPAYALAIKDAKGREVFAAPGLVRSPQDDFAFTLLEPLPRGAYTVELYGVDGARRTRLASYAFQVR